MDDIKISEMTLFDLESIENILFSDFDDFWNINTFRNELLNPNSKYIVAKLNNTIIGFGGLWKSVDDMHITDIVVKKSFRRQHIGSIILAKLIELAKSEKNIIALTLEVNSNNIPAQKLYEKFNFKKVGLRKKYYNNTDNAIIMTLKTRDISQSIRNTYD